MKPFLILQMRPVDEASDGEFQAFLEYGGLTEDEVVRVRIEKEGLPEINLEDYSGIIFGGGPMCVSTPEDEKPAYQKKLEKQFPAFFDMIIENDFPYFGACLGLQFLAHHLGAEVSTRRYSETVEAVTVTLAEAAKQDPLLQDIPGSFRAFGGHKDSVQEIPKGMTLYGSSEVCPHHFFKMKKNIYATQFHPELDTKNLIIRINVYKNKGYFPPEEAKPLIEKAKGENVYAPMMIFKNFVDHYRQ